MKQIIQSLKNGDTQIENIPAPRCRAGHILVQTQVSLVSAGTERMLVEFGKAGLISKARQQPEKVKQVLHKAKTDGIAATLEAVQTKMDQPVALGYCNVGRAIEVGQGIDQIQPGDRVISNGAHAEIVCVPKNLSAKIPDEVDDESASFTVLAAIGLQGIRLAQTTLGECVVVTGLGLIGLLTVQMLRAQGCRVLGIDMDPSRLALAQKFGAEVVNVAAGEDPVERSLAFSRGAGVDAVLITASTKSNDPVSQGAQMCRKRGRIVLVGVTGLQLNRSDFYEKELSFQVSCSYGPGRYDPAYEEGGQDYPIGFVRWTQQRNFEAVLDLMAAGSLNLQDLITHRFEIDQGPAAMELLTAKTPSLGILIQYSTSQETQPPLHRHVELSKSAATGKGVLGVLGAGNYASRALIPAFQKAGAVFDTLVSGGGVSAVHFGKKFQFRQAASDSQKVYEADDIDTVVIATQHNGHAGQVIKALEAGKHVYCEKPLCLTLNELDAITQTAEDHPDQHLIVGFNRRAAPHVVKMKSLLDTVEVPKSFVVTVNAGDIPIDHWTQDPEIGGGRIIGEACHFVDLLRHLVGHPITAYHAMTLGSHPAMETNKDKATLCLSFADGSSGVIHYLANGHKNFPKERVEVFCAGRVLQLDNFLTLEGWGWPKFSKMRLRKQNKGAEEFAQGFLDRIRLGQPAMISREEVLEVSRVSILLAEECR